VYGVGKKKGEKGPFVGEYMSFVQPICALHTFKSQKPEKVKTLTV